MSNWELIAHGKGYDADDIRKFWLRVLRWEKMEYLWLKISQVDWLYFLPLLVEWEWERVQPCRSHNCSLESVRSSLSVFSFSFLVFTRCQEYDSLNMTFLNPPWIFWKVEPYILCKLNFPLPPVHRPLHHTRDRTYLTSSSSKLEQFHCIPEQFHANEYMTASLINHKLDRSVTVTWCYTTRWEGTPIF